MIYEEHKFVDDKDHTVLVRAPYMDEAGLLDDPEGCQYLMMFNLQRHMVAPDGRKIVQESLQIQPMDGVGSLAEAFKQFDARMEAFVKDVAAEAGKKKIVIAGAPIPMPPDGKNGPGQGRMRL